MRVKHTLTARSKCPVDGAHDVYEVVVKVRHQLNVEDIIHAVMDLTDKPIFQEDFTRLLAARISAKVKTTGRHSGVKTVVRA